MPFHQSHTRGNLLPAELAAICNVQRIEARLGNKPKAWRSPSWNNMNKHNAAMHGNFDFWFFFVEFLQVKCWLWNRGYPQGRVPPVSRICEPDSLRGPKQAQCLYFKDLRQKGGNVGNVMLVIHKSSLTIFWSIAMEKKGLEQNTKSWLVNLTLFIRFHNLTWHTLTIWCPVLLPLPLPV